MTTRTPTSAGPGTTAAFDAAFAADTLPADPALFGPNAPKVKGGIDLVGDDYNANVAGLVCRCPPDPNPLDCNGHGSHVAGSAAGFGVLANGGEYTGSYDQLTHNNSFLIGPGVAPKADLYAVRVFGCEGSTDVVTEAIEWAIDNDMDVINMSLGSNFGPSDTADALAADDASKAGVVVVSRGNAGTSGTSSVHRVPAPRASRSQRVRKKPSTAPRSSRFPPCRRTAHPEHPGDQREQWEWTLALEPERCRSEDGDGRCTAWAAIRLST